MIRPAVCEETLKRQHIGHESPGRAKHLVGFEAIEKLGEETLSLPVHQEHMSVLRGAVRDHLRARQARVIIPIRENDPAMLAVIESVIEYAAEYVAPQHLYFIDNGSHASIVEGLRGTSVTVVEASRFAERLDLRRFHEILNLDSITSGLGYATFVGTAALALSGPLPDDAWIIRTDADIHNMAEYDPFAYLFAPAVQSTSSRVASYLKIAKAGRNNETVHAGINSLLPFIYASVPGDSTSFAADTAREIVESCTPHVWLLSGEYSFTWSLARQKMFATRFCDETFTSMQLTHHGFTQTLNPNPRIDLPNSPVKENTILTRICQFLMAVALEGRSPRMPWSIDEIAGFNRKFQGVQRISWLPPYHGPVESIQVPMDRILPSVELLISEGILR